MIVLSEFEQECQCVQCREIRAKAIEHFKKSEEYQKTVHQKREEFRAKLAKLGEVEHTKFTSKVLEAYDLVHCPELRKLKIYVGDVGVTTVNGRQVVCDINHLIDIVKMAGFKVEPNQK